MSSLSCCPNCYREAKVSIFSNFFPVHTCRDCGKKYCNDCGDGDGTICPECGSSHYTDYDKAYSK